MKIREKLGARFRQLDGEYHDLGEGTWMLNIPRTICQIESSLGHVRY
jgi:hypothetical protein